MELGQKMPKPLQLFADDNGEPGQRLDLEEDINMGQLDSSLGKKFTIFIFNSNHNILVDISDLDTENNRTTFHGPKIILPMETVKCSWTVKAKTDAELENINPFQDDVIHDRLSGAVSYENIELVLEKGSRPWGWKKDA